MNRVKIVKIEHFRQNISKCTGFAIFIFVIFAALFNFSLLAIDSPSAWAEEATPQWQKSGQRPIANGTIVIYKDPNTGQTKEVADYTVPLAGEKRTDTTYKDPKGKVTDKESEIKKGNTTQKFSGWDPAINAFKKKETETVDPKKIDPNTKKPAVTKKETTTYDPGSNQTQKETTDINPNTQKPVRKVTETISHSNAVIKRETEEYDAEGKPVKKTTESYEKWDPKDPKKNFDVIKKETKSVDPKTGKETTQTEIIDPRTKRTLEKKTETTSSTQKSEAKKRPPDTMLASLDRKPDGTMTDVSTLPYPSSPAPEAIAAPTEQLGTIDGCAKETVNVKIFPESVPNILDN